MLSGLKASSRIFPRKLVSKFVRSLSRDIGQPTHFTHPELLAENEVMPGIHKDEFAQRRSKLMELIGCSFTGKTHDKHVVIIPGAAIRYMSADVPYRFHQNTDFLYLTGFMEPDSVLLIESNEGQLLPDHKSVLYVRPRDPTRELWDGPRAGTDGALELTGIDESYTLKELSDHLENRYSREGYCVWYESHTDLPHAAHAELIVDSLTRSPHSKIKDVHSPRHNIAELRLFKSPSELALMRKAGELTGYAFKEAMKGSYEGVKEADLESIFEHSIKTNGAQWLSFPPVVAGGNRANCLHYIANNKLVKDGELVLMDAGCEYHGYVSDVTRTWPVNGRFSSAQADLYEVVRTTKEELIQLCRKGVTLNYLHSVAGDILATQLKTMGVLPNHLSSPELMQAMMQLFPHHVGHYLGMDTHDTMLVERNTPLSPGMVVTIEPGVYISENLSFTLTQTAKELLGTGIRLEDNVLITDGEAEILNKGCPESFSELGELFHSDLFSLVN